MSKSRQRSPCRDRAELPLRAACRGADLRYAQKRLTKSAIREPKQLQKLEFCQCQRPRFNLIEAAPIQMDRCDAEEVKGGDVGEGKNQLLKLFGYIIR